MKRKWMKLSALILVLVMVVSVFGNTAMAAGWGSTSWNPWGWFFGGQEKKETEAATEAAAEEAIEEAVEEAAEEVAEEAAEPAAEEVVEEAAEPVAEEVVEEAAEPVEEVAEPAEEAVEEAVVEEAHAPEVEEAEEIVVAKAPAVKLLARDNAVTAALEDVVFAAAADEGGTRDASDVSIAAGKTVTDNDEDGIYELALTIKATSDTSTQTTVPKSNVVLVIDVSGSMGDDNMIFSAYTYDSETYNSSNRYYNSTSTNYWGNPNGTRVYYRNGAWRTSNSNTGTVYGGTVYAYETRLDATKRAANAVVDALMAYNNNPDYNNEPDVFEITVVKFANRTAVPRSGYNGTETVIRDAKTATPVKNAINALTDGGGTNWQAALELAKTEADYFKGEGGDETTSVIFLTDGFPSYYGNDAGTGSDGNENNVQTSYNNSRAAARSIVSNGYKLYNIFAFGNDTRRNGHTGFEYLQALENWAHSTGNTDNYNATAVTREYCFNATSTEALVNAFKTIVGHLTNSVGYAGVDLEDGVSLGATSTSIAVNGQAKTDSLRYTVFDEKGAVAYTVTITNGVATFKDGTGNTLGTSNGSEVTTIINGTNITTTLYSLTVGEGEAKKTYQMSPATINADTGMVEWNLAALGILESGYTYKVAFDVWPNQVAYDIAADMNNGIYTSVDAALDGYGITDATERKHIKDAIVKNSDGSYSLYTNYEQKVEYYPATSSTNDQGQTTWTYGEKQSQPIPKPDPLPLKGSRLPLRKVWEAGLSQNELNELLWKNGEVGGTSNEYGITLHVWKADTEAALNAMISQPISDTNKPYQSYALGWDATAGTSGDYIWERDMAVAPGMMLNVRNAADLGFDTTDTSKIVTFDGTQYLIIEPGHYYYVTEEGSDLHFELVTEVYHPMVVDGDLNDVTFSGSTVTEMKPMGEVIATNYLKGGLDISKVVSTTQINVTDGVISNVTEPKKNGLKTVTDEFTYEIKLWKVDDSGNKSAVYTYDDQIKADGSATISGSIGYRIFSNPTATDGAGNITFGTQARGAILTENSQYADLANGIFATIANNETTIVLTMPANGEIRLVNLPAGTQYTVTEVLDEDGTAGGGYTYAATESTVKSSDDDITDPIVSTGNAVSGKITGNKANIETYYNWAANFYVYHSSNNTIEKISFADERVDSTYDAEKGYQYSFNIVDETAEGTLYGGYYKAYSQAGITKQAIVAAEYTADDNGKLWYQDSAGKPYDAKKANIWKKAEAYTTEVEETGGGKGTEMAPVANNVYYLKEVPNGYIRPYIHFTYDDIDPEKPLKHLYVITASDDTNYDYVGYVLGDSEEGTKATTSSLLITIKKANGKTEASLTASSVFKNKEYHGETVTLTRGYLHMSDLTTNIGKAFTFQPCWNTLDDVLVKGFTVRTVNAGTSAESIGVEDVAAN